MKRICLFGGSFDPVHLGHLLLAQAAREELAVERVFFIPAAQSPFKPNSEPAPAPQRLRLLRLALAGKEWCQVDEQEIARGGVSYTIDTLKRYKEENRDAQLHYLIGADNVAQLPKWRDASELAALAEFAAIPRPGESEQPFPPPFRGRYLKGFPLAISSSEIRERVRIGKVIEHLVPETVAQSIRNYRLYLG
jgi:nicotinate-nucleotide adenylyltransferase